MDTMWGTADPQDLQQVWGEQLWPFDGSDLRDALGMVGPTHQDYPPTLPQFIGLCRDARARRLQTQARISALKESGDSAFAARVTAGIGRTKTDPHAWAYRIIERVRNGEKLPPLSIDSAQEVILMHQPKEREVQRVPGEEG